MGTRQDYCHTHSTGEIIYLFTLTNAKGTEVSITNYGATITSFKLALENGERNDIVLGFEDVRDYRSPAYEAQYPWFGCAVGRYANRIGGAAFTLDGTFYALTKNNGANQLHGGKDGFDRKVWEVAGSGDSPQPFLLLRYLSRDGEEGFPGNLDVYLRFELTDNDELIHSYTATTDKPTPCNLTHHTYFNLNDGTGDILEHEIRIPASKYLEQTDDLVATGETPAVNGTPYDLREFRRIREGLDKIPEYDKSFVVDRGDGKMQVVAELRYAPRNILLQVISTEPILHFYSGKWTPDVKGKNGKSYGPWSGLCLETHSYPNAVNIPHFPSNILRPGETYFQKTMYRVTSMDFASPSSSSGA